MTSCSLCQKRNFKKLYQVGERSIEKCLNCRLVRTKGVAKVSYASYHRDQEYLAFETLFRSIFERRLKTIQRYKKKGKILDVGCSTGILLDVFKDAGWETWGVDPSRGAEIAKTKGHRTVRSTFKKAVIKRNFFDVVLFNHSLEHLENPLENLVKAKAVLKKGGLVYVDVPNFGSLSRKISGGNWKYLFPEEHLFHFTAETLGKMLISSGFKVIWADSWSGIFDYGSRFKLLRSAPLRIKLRVVKSLVFSPFSFVASFLNQGTSLALIGLKEKR